MLKSKLRMLAALAICAALFACGGGSSSSGANNSSVTGSGNNPAPNADTVPTLAMQFDSVSFGSTSDFNNATTVASLFNSLKDFFSSKNLGLIKTANAVSTCSNSRLVVGDSKNQWTSYDVLSKSSDNTIKTTDGADKECVTSIQDSSDYLVFTSSNLKSSKGICDLNVIKKADGSFACLTTDISGILGLSSPVSVTYLLGNRQISNNTPYALDYLMNSNGYNAAFTQNGKYLVAQFTATANNQNYIGVTRFDLTASSKPTATVVWLKPQNYSSYTYDKYLRGFIALEYGDVIVDYLDNFSTQGSDPNSNPIHPPIEGATRYYISVDPSISNPSSQKGFVLTSGYNASNGFAVTGKLWDFLSGNGPNYGKIAFTNYQGTQVYPYSGGVPLGGQVFINSDPNSADKVLYLKLTPPMNSKDNIGNLPDYVKVVIGSDVSVNPIQDVVHLGQTYTRQDYPSALIDGKLYSWSSYDSYQTQEGPSTFVTHSTSKGIYSHPISGASSTTVDTLVQQYAPVGYVQHLLQSRDSFFVLDAFNGYFGGNNTGNNKIYQTQVISGNATTTNMNIGALDDGNYTATNMSVNPITNQLQLSGAKKSNPADYTNSTLWSAYVDKSGVNHLTVFPNIVFTITDQSTPTKPFISLKTAAGTVPTYASH